MKTLWEEFNNCFKESRNLWNYYNSYFENPFNNSQKATEFIDKFLKVGGKSLAVNMSDTNCEVRRRNFHSVFVYFLGILLYNELGEELEIVSETGKNYEFPYLWYLVCLAHDYGYKYESSANREINDETLNEWCQFYLIL